MALDDAISKTNGTFNGVAINDNGAANVGFAPKVSRYGQNLNPDNKKVVFIVGKNAPAHYVVREAIETIADFGIHCDVYLTDVLPKGDDLKDKLARPETRNFGFFEKLMINHGDAVLETHDRNDGLKLNYAGELRSDLQYTPRQLAEYYSAKGVCINVSDMSDQTLPEKDRSINDPSFVQKIYDDNEIVRGYNVRGMQIMGKALIQAFEHKKWQHPNGATLEGRIINAHPGDVIQFPGTNIAFWARMKNFARNVWTLHVIDEGIDTGDFLDKTERVLKNGKTLMQDMLGMAKNAAGMISNDLTMFFSGSSRIPTPQNKTAKPAQNYSYATHQEHLDAFAKNIIGVNADDYIEALVKDYTGGLSSERSVDLHRTLAQATLDWQHSYIKIYQNEYSMYPPDYDPVNPQDYFVTVPPPYQPPGQTATSAPTTP